ncbi:alpha/beta hydrolase family esterase [Pseudonocardia spirodelae]|uniref:Poly(3-hydroxybutyrate) depolymerase n=1 Tax=Pseudonocardia spirodelae TaxID=3133431 RepID=A0ABU8T1P8_9PSEU
MTAPTPAPPPAPPHPTPPTGAARRGTRLLAAAAAVAVCAAGLLAGPATGTARAATTTPAGATPAGPANPAGPARGSAGCARTTDQAPGTGTDRVLTSGGVERTVRVHLPASYRPGHPTPVVLVFHGRGNSGATTEEFTGLSGLPAIVAYPDGVPGDEGKQAWQGAPYSAPGVDDVAFTADLLDELETGLCVDPGRVFATGKSNGGGFTEILACRMADRIAAIAPVAGAYYRAGEPPCAPGRAVPALFVHGTGDATIPYAGDAARGLPAIGAKVAEWVARDGCRARPQTRRTEPDVTTTTWRGCRSGARVAHVAVDGGGHTWPGALAYSGGGYTTRTVRATELVGEFFGLTR